MPLSELAMQNMRAHLSSCSECSTELSKQANLELGIRQIADEVSFCASCEQVVREQRCSHCGAAAWVSGYQIEGLLVENSRGRIYVARDDEGQRVALKELAFVQSPSAEDIAAFERESSILRTLDHPGIPRFVAAFQEGEGVNTRFYLAQQYVDGESLEEKLQHHHFDESEVVEIAQRVLELLAYLQSLSPMVFHRDIKPSNILCDKNGKIFLVDFGAARSLGPTVSATLVGTFGYMPVEQLGGIVDASSDVYALGASLCHLLTRREPWHLLEDRSLLRRMNVSAGLEQVISKMVAPKPTDRYPDALAALQALKARNTSQQKTSIVERLATLLFVPRRALVFAGVGAALVAGGIAGLSTEEEKPMLEVLAIDTPEREPLPLEDQADLSDLVISSQPSGAHIFIEGVFQGKTPLTLRRPIGNVAFEVRKEGYHSLPFVASLKPEQDTRVQLKLDSVHDGTGADIRISQVKVGGAEELAESDLDPASVIRRIQDKYLPGIKRCHQQILKEDPNAEGKVIIRFTVGPTGRVSKSSAKGFNPTLDACINKQVATWRFAAPKDDDGRPTSVGFDVPLLLKGDEEESKEPKKQEQDEVCDEVACLVAPEQACCKPKAKKTKTLDDIAQGLNRGQVKTTMNKLSPKLKKCLVHGRVTRDLELLVGETRAISGAGMSKWSVSERNIVDVRVPKEKDGDLILVGRRPGKASLLFMESSGKTLLYYISVSHKRPDEESKDTMVFETQTGAESRGVPRLRVSVEPNGLVGDLQVKNADAKVSKCIRGIVEKAQFPKTDKASTFEFPISIID
jgi:serine/threonine protein kinase